MRRNFRQRRRATVSIMVAFFLVVLLSVVAIAVDGGMLLDNKRSVQAAADAAAYAAAVELFNGYGTNSGLDPSGTAKASALSYASSNGFSNDGVNSVVTVNIPPTSGIASGKAGYAEVIVQYNQPRGFSSIIGSGRIPVKARAVARGNPGDVGILLLDPHLTVAGQIVGNINILNGGQIYCNSDSTVLNDEFKGYGTVGGVYLESTCKLSCGGVNVVGSMSAESGSSVTYTNGGGLKTGVGPWADPLASVPEPVPTGTSYGNKTCSGVVTIQPGIYGNLTINNGATVTMAPGIYYISSSGGISMKGGTLTGNGVMIYNQSGDSLDFANADAVTLTPPTSGTYRGISIFQPRAETKEVHIKASGPVTISGTLYAQAGEFDLRPNGATTVMNCGNYICAQAEWAQGYGTGKSDGIINLNPGTAAPSKRPQLIE